MDYQKYLQEKNARKEAAINGLKEALRQYDEIALENNEYNAMGTLAAYKNTNPSRIALVIKNGKQEHIYVIEKDSLGTLFIDENGTLAYSKKGGTCSVVKDTAVNMHILLTVPDNFKKDTCEKHDIVGYTSIQFDGRPANIVTGT